MTSTQCKRADRLTIAARLLSEGLRQKDVAEELGMTRGGLNNMLSVHAPSLCFRASGNQAEAARKWLLSTRGRQVSQAAPARKKKTQGCVYWRTDKHGVCGEPVFKAGYCRSCFPKTAPLVTPYGGMAL